MGAALQDLDRTVLYWINGHHNAVLDWVLIPVNAVGEAGFCWIAAAALMVVYGGKEEKRTALLLLAGLLITDLLVARAVKAMWERPRPYTVLSGLNVEGRLWTNPSFPSGHAHAAALGAFIISGRWPRALWPLVFFAVATCYARPYFGLHYPSDVLAGVAIGSLVGFGLVMLRRRLWPRRPEATAQEDSGVPR